MEAETGAEQDPELWPHDEDEAEEMEGFDEARAPGGPLVEVRQARNAVAERTPMTPPQQKEKTRTTEPDASEKGSAPLSQVQLLPVQTMQNPMDTELATLSQRACALIPALEKFLTFCLLSLRAVAWFCSRRIMGTLGGLL